MNDTNNSTVKTYNTTYSTSGRAAIRTGEMPLYMWNRKTMLDTLKYVAKRDHWYHDDLFSYENWKGISTKIMQRHLLYQTSWHHVNRKPVWFYSLSTERLTKYKLYRMTYESNLYTERQSKPRLVNVKHTVWKWSADGRHQFSQKKNMTGVSYRGRVYYENGKYDKIERGKCEIVGDCGPIVKEKRDMFEKIVHQMRENYDISI